MGAAKPAEPAPGGMTIDQMNKIMSGAKLTSDQSAGALGHSTGMIGNMLKGGWQGLTDLSSGFSKGALQTVDAIAAPGKALEGLAGSALEAGGLKVGDSAKGNMSIQGLESKNMTETVGKGIETAVELLAPIGPKKLAAVEAVPKVIGEVNKLASVSEKIATKRLASTAETMTKRELAQAAKEERISPKGLVTASKTEQRAGSILKGKLFSNPAKNVKTIKTEIAKRGEEVQQYLEKNAKPITPREDEVIFKQREIESAKYMTPTAQNAYKEQVQVFRNLVKDFGPPTTDTYYKALKDFETNVTENLPKGKEALLDEGGSGRIQAAKDVREIVRDFVGQKHEEFSDKMFDLTSLYDAKDSVVGKTVKMAQESTTFAKRHPVITSLGGAAAGVAGYDEVKKAFPGLP